MKTYSPKNTAPVAGTVQFGSALTDQQCKDKLADALVSLGVPRERVLCIYWGGIWIAVDLLHVLMAA